MDAKGFSEVLKELRTRKKLSRSRVAQQLRVHPSTLEKWERGDVLPDRGRVEELIRALKLVEAEELLLREAHAGYRILPSLHNLPAPQNLYFTGRDTILTQLHDQLAPGSQVALTQSPQAISGIGGIGKTQVALHYAYRFQKSYSHVLWATAHSREMLTTEFVRLAQDLDLPEKNEQDQSKIVRAMQRWLREYLDWLLILDNVEDLELVNTFIPAGYLGSLLLTTRRQVTEPVAQTLALDVFSPEHGALFLLKRTRRLAVQGSRDEAEASEIVMAQSISQHLGGLPLALDQAGAYIAENRCSLSHYLDLFKQQQTILLRRRGTVPSHHPQSVTTTFSLAFEQIQQKNEAALELLKLCAYLVPDTIPLEVITEGAPHLGTILEPVAKDALQLDQVLEILQTYSLVQRDAANHTLSIHRLVQVVLQATLEEGEQRRWVKRMILALNAAFPHMERNTASSNWSRCERLLSHALLAVHYIKADHITNREAVRLLHETAFFLQDRARYAEAELLYCLVLLIKGNQSVSTYPDTITELANIYLFQGKHGKAETLYQQALSSYQQQLGPGHPDTARGIHDLAYFYWTRGKYVEAEPLYQQALVSYQQQLGPEHPDTARGINDLAALYREQGKYIEAEPLYQQALAIYEQQLGRQHLKTATTLINLSILYRYQKKGIIAEQMLKRSIAIREQQLGLEHPYVAYCLNNMADLYYEQDKYAEAELLYQRALDINERQLGSEHPDIAFSLNGLANLYREQSKYTKAERLYQRALHIREQAQGQEHPDIAETSHDLAQLREVQGDSEDAKALYTRALTVREQALGVQHTRTIQTRTRLIALLHTTGQHEQAAQLETTQTQ